MAKYDILERQAQQEGLVEWGSSAAYITKLYKLVEMCKYTGTSLNRLSKLQIPPYLRAQIEITDCVRIVSLV